MDKEIVLAADLGGTNLRMAAIDRHGKILYRVKRPTPRGDDAAEIVRAIVESAGQCSENCAGSEIKAVSAAVPGTIKTDEGIIVKSPNLTALDNFRMVEALERELDFKALLENDANAAAVGESWLGASKRVSNSVFITLGTGVGGGIIIDGKILRGANGVAGEIGHIGVDSMGVLCPCGSRGCLERYSSASAIVRMAKELKPQFPETKLKNYAGFTAFEVFQAGTNGDALALEVFRKMGFYLGAAITSLLNVFDSSMIVIGGGASAGWDLFFPQMKETIDQRAYGGNSERVEIVKSELGDDAGILGAARLAFDFLPN